MLKCRGTQFLLSRWPETSNLLELLEGSICTHMEHWWRMFVCPTHSPYILYLLIWPTSLDVKMSARTRAISGTSVILGTLALSREPQTAKPKQKQAPQLVAVLFGCCLVLTLLRTTPLIQLHRNFARRVSEPQWRALLRAWPRSTQYICSPKREPQTLVMQRL